MAFVGVMPWPSPSLCACCSFDPEAMEDPGPEPPLFPDEDDEQGGAMAFLQIKGPGGRGGKVGFGGDHGKDGGKT